MVNNISNGIPQIALELYIQFVEDGCHQNVTPLVMKNCTNSWSIMKFAIGPHKLVYVQCKALQNAWWSLALLAHWKYIVAFWNVHDYLARRKQHKNLKFQALESIFTLIMVDF